jgi:hypothetical protein
MLPVICVDFDGVIASWHQGTFYEPGPPIPGSKEFLEKLSEIGRVVICTCRTNSELYDDEPVAELRQKLESWFLKWEMMEFVDDIYTSQGKPYAACYIDDKAIPCDPEDVNIDEFSRAVECARVMCSNGKAHPQKGATPLALMAAGDAP